MNGNVMLETRHNALLW